jgi:hypothetical protein
MAASYLAFMEWQAIPDESYFSDLFQNFYARRYVDPATGKSVGEGARIIKTNLRYIHFPHRHEIEPGNEDALKHPNFVTQHDLPKIEYVARHDGVFACRKVSLDMMSTLDTLRDCSNFDVEK